MLHFPMITLIFITSLLSSATATATHTVNRRLLHQPFFSLDQPLSTISLPPSPSPQPQPQPQPKYPFSRLYPPHPTTTPQNPFFPSYPYPPPPTLTPSSTTTTATNFPANISSLVLPSSSSHSSHKTIKLISLILSLSLFSCLLLASFLFRRRSHRNRPLKADKVHLFHPETPTSDTTTDASTKPPAPPPPLLKPASTSSEFIYLGTVVSSRDADNIGPAPTQKDEKAPPAVRYLSLGSPELHPLPSLPRQQHQQIFNNEVLNSPENDDRSEGINEEEEEEFFSPRGSTVNIASPYRSILSPPLNTEFVKSMSFNSSNSCSPSVVLNIGSQRTTELSSPDSFSDFPASLPRFTIPPPVPRELRAFSTFSPSSNEDCSSRASDFSDVWKVPPPAPPPPPERFWEAASAGGPPELVGPTRKVVNGRKGSFGNSGEIGKPKLKPLHWDKVRASSDKTMVWDHLKSSSFKLNEEMIETLFMVNSSTKNPKDGARRQIIPDVTRKNLVLDPKKSQNTAILLRALNVTIEEVCEALSEGNGDTLGTELLESLLKMAPTEEEERKLKEMKDDLPFKLGTAETFLKALVDIPFAFQRVDAMLYIANFDSEVEYLKRCFSTLESACKELKNSKMFLKLLEAVLRTGNRMNVGTNRGEAHAFKLDTLLKLVDIKGTDGKTTLLHFVVHEIIKTEGARLSGVDHNPMAEESRQSTLQDEVYFRKLSLQVVSGLSGELTNVKKAATMETDLIHNDVSKLATGVAKISEVIKLNEELSGKDKNVKFANFMSEFLNKAEGEIVNIQAQEVVALSMVKGLTEYFHGDSGKEEAHPFRLFVVVRDFLCALDRVCKDVGKINERNMVSSGKQIQTPENPVVRGVFPGLSEAARWFL